MDHYGHRSIENRTVNTMTSRMLEPDVDTPSRVIRCSLFHKIFCYPLGVRYDNMGVEELKVNKFRSYLLTCSACRYGQEYVVNND